VDVLPRLEDLMINLLEEGSSSPHLQRTMVLLVSLYKENSGNDKIVSQKLKNALLDVLVQQIPKINGKSCAGSLLFKKYPMWLHEFFKKINLILDGECLNLEELIYSVLELAEVEDFHKYLRTEVDTLEKLKKFAHGLSNIAVESPLIRKLAAIITISITE